MDQPSPATASTTPPTTAPGAPATAPGTEAGWDPVGALRRQIDRLFDDLDPRIGRAVVAWPGAGIEALRGWGVLGGGDPPLDLVDRGDRFELRADVPGMAREDLALTVADGMLTLRGETRAESERDDEAFHLRERTRSRFERSLRLPASVDAGRIAARLADGVLMVDLPKSAREAAPDRTIEIRGS